MQLPLHHYQHSIRLFRDFKGINYRHAGNFLFLKPSYKPAVWVDETVSVMLAGFFIFFEILNLITHVVLRNLRRAGTNQRGIPQGWGFELVSCANYFWETLAWLTFAVFVQNWGAYLFLVMGFA